MNCTTFNPLKTRIYSYNIVFCLKYFKNIVGSLRTTTNRESKTSESSEGVVLYVMEEVVQEVVQTSFFAILCNVYLHHLLSCINGNIIFYLENRSVES